MQVDGILPCITEVTIKVKLIPMSDGRHAVVSIENACEGVAPGTFPIVPDMPGLHVTDWSLQYPAITNTLFFCGSLIALPSELIQRAVGLAIAAIEWPEKPSDSAG